MPSVTPLEIDADVDALSEYLIAVTEIATNAIEVHETHGIANPVIAKIHPAKRVVVVTDRAGGFDLDAKTTMPPPYAPRGRGLFLAQAFCLRLSWQRTSDGMTFTLPFD